MITVHPLITFSGVPSLSGKTTLRVELVKNNQKSLDLDSKYHRIEVIESTSVGVTVTALNIHESVTNTLNFERVTAIDRYGQPISSNTIFKNFFTIDQKAGNVSVGRKLDRNVAATISISNFAVDSLDLSMKQLKGIPLQMIDNRQRSFG